MYKYKYSVAGHQVGRCLDTCTTYTVQAHSTCIVSVGRDMLFGLQVMLTNSLRASYRYKYQVKQKMLEVSKCSAAVILLEG